MSRVLGDLLDLAHVHHLGNDLQAVAIRRRAQELQPLHAHPLERVGRRAGLVRPAPQHLRARRRDRLGGSEQHLLALDGAGTRHHADLRPADGHPVAEVDHARRPARLAGHELVGLGDEDHVLDAREALQRVGGVELVLLAPAHRADDRLLDPDDGIDPVAQLLQPRGDLVHLGGRGATAHDDDHRPATSRVWDRRHDLLEFLHEDLDLLLGPHAHPKAGGIPEARRPTG